jgi:death-on-curing protein
VPNYLSPSQILRIAEAFLEHPPEVRDLGLLDSALHRPASSMMGQELYPTLDLKAAALLDSVVNNHALIDGNKRLGLLAVHMFYGLNGEDFDAPHEPLYDLIMSVADGSNRDLDKIAATLAAWRQPRR